MATETAEKKAPAPSIHDRDFGEYVVRVDVSGDKRKQWIEKKETGEALTPALERYIRLYFNQGWPEKHTSSQLGVPIDLVKVIYRLESERLLAKGEPLPTKLGRPQANETPPSASF